MHYLPLEISIKHDWFDVFSLLINVIIGLTALFSIFLSRRALVKSEIDSAMVTSPSIVLRSKNAALYKRKRGYVEEHIRALSELKKYEELFIRIDFECFNSGRGIALNLQQPKTVGMNAFIGGLPIYMPVGNEPWVRFSGEVPINRNDINILSENPFPISVEIKYTNDQDNVSCSTIWSAKIKFSKIDNSKHPPIAQIIDDIEKITYEMR